MSFITMDHKTGLFINVVKQNPFRFSWEKKIFRQKQFKLYFNYFLLNLHSLVHFCKNEKLIINTYKCSAWFINTKSAAVGVSIHFVCIGKVPSLVNYQKKVTTWITYVGHGTNWLEISLEGAKLWSSCFKNLDCLHTSSHAQ